MPRSAFEPVFSIRSCPLSGQRVNPGPSKSAGPASALTSFVRKAEFIQKCPLQLSRVRIGARPLHPPILPKCQNLKRSPCACHRPSKARESESHVYGSNAQPAHTLAPARSRIDCLRQLPPPTPSLASPGPDLLRTNPDSFWNQLRDEQFSIPPQRICLNNGSLGVIPKSVLKEMTVYLQNAAALEMTDPPRWGYETLDSERRRRSGGGGSVRRQAQRSKPAVRRETKAASRLRLTAAQQMILRGIMLSVGGALSGELAALDFNRVSTYGAHRVCSSSVDRFAARLQHLCLVAKSYQPGRGLHLRSRQSGHRRLSGMSHWRRNH